MSCQPLPPLPFPDKSFDLIVAVSLLGQLREQHQIEWLKELRRVARPNSVLLISTCGLTQLALARAPGSIIRAIEQKGFLISDRNPDLDEVLPNQSFYVSGLHSRAYVRAMLEQYFSVVDVVDAIIANDDLFVLKNDRDMQGLKEDGTTLPNSFSIPLRDYDINPFIHPTSARSGYGGHLVSSDGKDYVDFMSAWGTNLLGYGYRKVARAAARQAKRFSGLGLPYPQFYELREWIRRIVPSAEDVRYGKNGSDACAGAVRLATYLTGREKILFHGYHGFHDWYFASTDCPGIPACLKGTVICQPDIHPAAVADSFRKYPGTIAALILNPLTSIGVSSDDIKETIAVVHHHDGMIIFDEMLSGFRVAPGGMQELWSVKPDLSCFGKGIANGFPLSVVCGPGEYIRRLPETYYGMTFEGEAVSIAAACATLQELVEKDVVAALYEKGRSIRSEYQRIAKEYGVSTSLVGYEPCMHIDFQPHGRVDARELLWLLNQELTRRGIFTLGAFILCYSHTARDIKRLVAALEASMSTVRDAVDRGSTERLLDERIRSHMEEVQAPANWRRADSGDESSLR